MAQPAIVRDEIGLGSHEIVQQVPGAKLRLTNFVECQAPMFKVYVCLRYRLTL